jgi:hypothetical protein
MGGFALVMIGMAVMLIAPLQRVTAGRRETQPDAITQPIAQARQR